MATSTTSGVHRDASSDQPPPRKDPVDEGAGSRIWLYRGDGNDAPVRYDDFQLTDLDGRQMLWADVDIQNIEGLDELWQELGIVDLVAGLAETGERPGLVQHDGLLQLTVTALDPESEPMALHCLVGENWVVTLHAGTLHLVDEFNKPFNGETRLGELDGPAFLSVVLDWQVSGYFRVIEELQSAVDHLDEELLQRFPDEVGLLHRLQALRRRVRELRSTLGSHREVFELLSHPESETVIGSETAPNYQRLGERLQQAMDAVDTTRDMIVGSFDMFMTRTAQATNDIMKRLTTISLLLLPAVVIAGIMGMNFEVGIFERPWMFWVTLGMMAMLAVVTLLVAKRQKWF